jgi:hypothetical protein
MVDEPSFPALEVRVLVAVSSLFAAPRVKLRDYRGASMAMIGPTVLRRMMLGPAHHATGATRHYCGNVELPPPVELRIARYGGAKPDEWELVNSAPPSN